MRTCLLIAIVVAGCTGGPSGYYVANVYQDGSGNLSVQKCAISGENGFPEPGQCHVEAVGPAPRVADGTSRPVVEQLMTQ